ncbi:MAG: group III truncated hemoglobin [Chitinophagales bacterium]|nr:group III truncated hemoglobin [Chitinophagales bacterium]
MNDIQNRADVEILVNEFYKKVIPDTIIGNFFTKVVSFSRDIHIPVMISFLETILFGTASYSGNPMKKHVELNNLLPLEPLHFERWLGLWKETIYENFEEPKATEAINRAQSIAQIMQIKIKVQGLYFVKLISSLGSTIEPLQIIH